MLNYIRAELWKVSRRGSFYVVTGVLLFLAHLFGFTFSGNSFLQLTGGVCTTMITGFMAAPALAQLVDNGFSETVRNEVSFGLSREEIYLGKLISGILLGMALCGVLIGGVLLSGWMFLKHGDPVQELTVLGILLFCLMSAMPIWCGMLSLCHMMATLIRSQAAWMSLYFLGFLFGQPIGTMVLMMLTGGRVSLDQPSIFQGFMLPWTLLIGDSLSGELHPYLLIVCWVVGLGWMLLTTAAGLIVLRRKDIR